MFMNWNPLKKDQKDKEKEEKVEAQLAMMPGAKDMNMFQRFAMKRFLNMSPENQQKVVAKTMKPENVAKHKGEIMAQLDMLKKAGKLSDDQYRLAKRRLGL